jgi:hypothetical protein
MDYQLHYLAPRKLDQAFPLAQLAEPGLTLDRWRDFAGSYVFAERSPHARPPSRAIVFAEDASGYIHGLACYAVQEDLLSRRLRVHDFVVCSMFGAEQVADTLLAHIEEVALALGCSEIGSEIPHIATLPAAGNNASIDRFIKRGYQAQALRLCRPVSETGSHSPVPPARA